MKDIEYTSPSELNYTYDGRVMSIQGVRSKSAEVVNIPPQIDGVPVTTIGNAAFAFNHSLKRVILPDSVSVIENSAFKNCQNLVDAVLSRELNVLGAFAFADCENLRRVTISNHTTRFEINTFKNCRRLEVVRVKVRESDEIREFLIAPESDEAIWTYLRAVLQATDYKHGFMDTYDTTFMDVRDEDFRFNIALSRLQNPVGLAPDMRKVFENCLAGMVLSVIRSDRVDKLTSLGELGCIDLDSIDEYIDVAGRIGGGCIAYLLEHKNRHKENYIHDFSL